MTFWPRTLSAIMCWFASMLVLIVTAAHYVSPMQPSEELWVKILLVLAIGAGAIAVLAGVLFFWLWVWTKKYW